MSIIGLGFIGAAAFIFVYCSVWIFATPFLPKQNPIQQFFLPISVLTIGPHILLLVALLGVAAFLVKSNADKKKKN
ncbi:hypothetical protein ABPG73_013557 [Tetrahymena malaccensis]